MNSISRFVFVVLVGVALVAAAFAWLDTRAAVAEAAAPQQEEAADAVAEAAEPQEEAKEEKKESPEELAEKREDLERKLNIAKMKLEVAAMELEAQKVAAELSVRHAREELEIARGKLEQFRSIDAPNRLDSARLSLQSAKDRAVEAAEELEQIEIMYEGQDLDDRTAEFVVSRGRRNAERAAQRISIQEGQLKALEQHELPRETRSMELSVERKEADVDKAARSARTGELQKRIGVLSAESEVAKLEDQLRDLDKKASEG